MNSSAQFQKGGRSNGSRFRQQPVFPETHRDNSCLNGQPDLFFRKISLRANENELGRKRRIDHFTQLPLFFLFAMRNKFLISNGFLHELRKIHRFLYPGHPRLLRLQHGAFHNGLHSVPAKLLLFRSAAFQRNNFRNTQLCCFFQKPFKAVLIL